MKPLKVLSQTTYTQEHLPDIPPEQAMQRDGLNVNEFQIQLLQKIEELSLYLIQQDKTIKELQQEIRQLKDGQ